MASRYPEHPGLAELQRALARVGQEEMDRRGWDQHRLAREAGVSQATVSSFVRGASCTSRSVEAVLTALEIQDPLARIMAAQDGEDGERPPIGGVVRRIELSDRGDWVVTCHVTFRTTRDDIRLGQTVNL